MTKTARKNEIDLASLRGPVSHKEIDELYKKYKKLGKRPNNLRDVLLMTVVTIIAVLLVGGYFVLQGDMNVQQLAVMSYWVTGLAVLLILGFKVYSYARIRKLVRMDRFAKANDTTLIFDVYDPSYNGVIFEQGHTREINEAYQLPGGIEIGNYTYIQGYGKHRSTWPWVYVRVPLSRKLPHMVLDSRKNNVIGVISNLPAYMKHSQSLQLEGDFNKYFNVYVPEQYATDALYVLTPDVMATLIEHARSYDVEIVDDYFYLYRSAHAGLTNPDRLGKLLDAVDKVESQITKQAKGYADSRIAHARDKNVVLARARRLKRGIPIWVIVLTVIMFGSYSANIIAPSGFTELLIVFAWMLFLGLGWAIIISSIVRRFKGW